MNFLASTLATLLLASSLLAAPSWAASDDCERAFRSDPENIASDPEAQLENLFRRATDGISDRGFLSSEPAVTPELASLAGRRGLMWWAIKIYVMPSLAEARAHSANETNPLLQGVYLIRENTSFAASEDLTRLPAPTVFRELMAQSPLYFFKDGNPERIDPDFVAANIGADGLVWKGIGDPKQGPFIHRTGWTFPKQRGVVLEADTLDSSTYKETRRIARKLIREGWRITFNRDYKQALDRVAAQKRKKGNQWIPDSRFTDPATYQAALNSFKSGRVYSVEVWNEKGELVGGIIGEREGALYSPDSTFYDQERYPKLSIGIARMAAVALTDRVYQAGIPFIDTGMVTNFTASLKGRLIDSREFLEMINRLPSDIPAVDLNSDWNP